MGTSVSPNYWCQCIDVPKIVGSAPTATSASSANPYSSATTNASRIVAACSSITSAIPIITQARHVYPAVLMVYFRTPVAVHTDAQSAWHHVCCAEVSSNVFPARLARCTTLRTSVVWTLAQPHTTTHRVSVCSAIRPAEPVPTKQTVFPAVSVTSTVRHVWHRAVLAFSNSNSTAAA